jgi:hypothetical protein
MSSVVGKVIEIRHVTKNAGIKFNLPPGVAAGDFFPIKLDRDAPTGANYKVPAVLIRQVPGQVDSFTVVSIDMIVKLGDVIWTSPEWALAIEFIIGGRVGINPGAKVKIASERSVVDVAHHGRILMRKGGMWAKGSRLNEPLEIQTNGGVMGIKG